MPGSCSYSCRIPIDISLIIPIRDSNASHNVARRSSSMKRGAFAPTAADEVDIALTAGLDGFADHIITAQPALRHAGEWIDRLRAGGGARVALHQPGGKLKILKVDNGLVHPINSCPICLRFPEFFLNLMVRRGAFALNHNAGVGFIPQNAEHSYRRPSALT